MRTAVSPPPCRSANARGGSSHTLVVCRRLLRVPACQDKAKGLGKICVRSCERYTPPAWVVLSSRSNLITSPVKVGKKTHHSRRMGTSAETAWMGITFTRLHGRVIAQAMPGAAETSVAMGRWANAVPAVSGPVKPGVVGLAKTDPIQPHRKKKTRLGRLLMRLHKAR